MNDAACHQAVDQELTTEVSPSRNDSNRSAVLERALSNRFPVMHASESSRDGPDWPRGDRLALLSKRILGVYAPNSRLIAPAVSNTDHPLIGRCQI